LKSYRKAKLVFYICTPKAKELWERGGKKARKKENKKRLKEVWLLEINFLLLQPEAKELWRCG
jgi:hypothetical protein